MQEQEQLPSGQSAFIAELRHWREVTGYSQKALARAVGYTPSYISKVEGGSILPSREFAMKADQVLTAGRSIVRRWRDLQASGEPATNQPPNQPETVEDLPATALVVEHEHAELAYVDGIFRTLVRRLVRNVGNEPITQ